MSLTIDHRPVYTDYIRIENLAQFKVRVPMLYPDDPAYNAFWSLQNKRCIEGVWGQMNGKWRYMRGNLYFYMNFTLIEQTDKNKKTQYLPPIVTDLEWELSYGLMVARGFSGFSKDEKYTSMYVVRDMISELGQVEGEKYLRQYHPEAFNKKGVLKEYIDPLEYCRQLHDKPIGRPIYLNETLNFMPFGSRGGGKSYYIADGELLHGLLFDGATVFDEDANSGKLTAQFCIGAADGEKSSEFCDKISVSLNALTDPELGKQFGVWGRPSKKKGEKSEFFPCPFYRHFRGGLDVSNKDNPFEYVYEVLEGGKPVERGTRTKLLHVNYSPTKARGKGGQAAAGGRYAVSVIEEAGLVENLIDVHTSNESTLAREGNRFGTEIYIGTSGNMKTVHAAKKMFLNPQDYKILSYKNHFGSEGKDGQIGFFIPFYMTLRQYKDKDGNTDYDRATAHVNRIRRRAREATDPKLILDEKMNRPCFVEEMWLNPEGSLMPVVELQAREKELIDENKFQRIGTAVKLFYDKTTPQGVGYMPDPDGEPYTEWPLDFQKRKMPTGCPVIYEVPNVIGGIVPDDMYNYVGHDPYVQQDITKGGSVGATYIIMNPKYIPLGFKGNIIVASYIDKPLGGLDSYYENLEKLLMLYGNPKQGLWFEKNQGQDCRNHFLKKNKPYLLAPTPQHAQGTNIFQKNINSYGYHTGSGDYTKSSMATWMRDWLLRETTFNDPNGFGLTDTKRNVDRLPCIFLVRQLINYNLDDNFDAVDGFRGAIVGLMNDEIRQGIVESKRQETDNRLRGYYQNPKIFKNVEREKRRGLH